MIVDDHHHYITYQFGFNVDVYEEYDKRRMILIKDEHFDSCDPDWRQVLEDYGVQGSEVLEEFLLLPS